MTASSDSLPPSSPTPDSGPPDFLRDPCALQVPWIDSPFFEAQLAAAEEDDEWKRRARAFAENGLLVLENFIDDDLIDRLVEKTHWLFDPSTEFEGLPPEVVEVITRAESRRQDAWAACEELRELACYPAILDLLRSLYRREPFPFQILNFKVGTEQDAHSDAMHFDSVPEKFMCGVWVALEDTTEDNGPLFYYPGSHRLPLIHLEHLGRFAEDQLHAAGDGYARYLGYLEAVVRAAGFERQTLCVPKGTAVVWAANVLHGGSSIRRPGTTRMSQVTHYFFDGCTYYSPILSNPAIGELRLKSVYDIHAHREVPHTLNGVPIEAQLQPNGTHRIGRIGSLLPLEPPPSLWKRISWVFQPPTPGSSD